MVAFSKPSHCPVISHLAFADDIVIFANGAKQSLQHLMNFLNTYEIESSQLIRKGKSCFIVGDSTPSTRCQIIEQVTGFQRKKLSVKYLVV